MRNFGKKIILWIPAFIWMLFIFYLSSKTRLKVSDEFSLNFIFFKTLHVIEYCFLALTYFFAIQNSHKSVPNNNGKSSFWLAAFLTLVYAATDEWHQDFVPTREGTPRDILIDAIGVLAAYRISNSSLFQRISDILATTVFKMR